MERKYRQSCQMPCARVFRKQANHVDVLVVECIYQNSFGIKHVDT